MASGAGTSGSRTAPGRATNAAAAPARSAPARFQIDGRLPPKERVVTVGEGDAAVAYPYSELRKVGVAAGTLGREAYVVFWSPGTASALSAPTIDEGEDIGATGNGLVAAGWRGP